MPILLVFQRKFTEKYFKKFHLPQIQFQFLNGHFIDLLPYYCSGTNEPDENWKTSILE